MYFMHLNFVGSYVALVVESEPYVSINLNYQKTAANLNNPNVCMCMTPFAYYLSCALNWIWIELNWISVCMQRQATGSICARWRKWWWCRSFETAAPSRTASRRTRIDTSSCYTCTYHPCTFPGSGWHDNDLIAWCRSFTEHQFFFSLTSDVTVTQQNIAKFQPKQLADPLWTRADHRSGIHTCAVHTYIHGCVNQQRT